MSSVPASVGGGRVSEVEGAVKDCVFCQIIAGQEPAAVLTENDAVITFLSLDRHPLIVPKRHVRDIYSLSDDLGAAIMREAIRLARAVKAGLHCDGIYLAQANEPAAGQDVFHFHLHIYPSWHGDRLGTHHLPGPAEVQARIAAALAAQPPNLA